MGPESCKNTLYIEWHIMRSRLQISWSMEKIYGQWAIITHLSEPFPQIKNKKNTHAPSGFTNNLTCNTEDVFCSSSPHPLRAPNVLKHPTALQPTPGYLGVFVEVLNPKPSNPHLEGKSTTPRKDGQGCLARFRLKGRNRTYIMLRVADFWNNPPKVLYI